MDEDRDVRLRQLENFIAVCETGSISRAAERRHVAQPALGLQMRGIEHEMGALLLQRHARGVQPTAAGLLVLEWARETVRGAQEVKRRLRQLAGGTSGALTLGMPPSIARLFSVPVLLAAQRELPDLRLLLVEGMGQALRDWTAAGRLDLALVFEATGGAREGPETLLTDHLYCVSPWGGETPHNRSIGLAEVLLRPLAMAAPGDSVRDAVEDAARRLDAAVDVRYEVHSTGVMLQLVRSGLASTVLPLATVLDDLEAGRLQALRIVSPPLKRHLHWLACDAPADAGAAACVKAIVERIIRSHAGPLRVEPMVPPPPCVPCCSP